MFKINKYIISFLINKNLTNNNNKNLRIYLKYYKKINIFFTFKFFLFQSNINV